MADIETSFQAAIDAGKINGAVLCATDAEGRFVYSKALGSRTLLSGERVPVQLDDLLTLASATKLLTTIAALQCVDDGLLSLTGDLSSLAPELASKYVLTGFSEDGVPLLEPAERAITLEMLLTHGAGINYSFTSPLIARWCATFSPPTPNTRKPVEALFDYPLTYQPGSGWMYGAGVDWAGRIVERATDMSLSAYMQQRIFAPLGIADAAFYPIPSTRPDLLPRLVDRTPADPDALGLAVMGAHASMNTQTLGDFGGHGLSMSGTDYAKVLRALLLNGGGLLKPSTVDAMFAPRLGGAAAEAHQEALDGPGAALFRVGTAPGAKVGLGLGGLLTLEDVEGWYGARTLTWGGGQTLTWFVDPESGLCGVGAVLATVPMDLDAVGELKDSFRHDIYRKHAGWKREQTIIVTIQIGTGDDNRATNEKQDVKWIWAWSRRVAEDKIDIAVVLLGHVYQRIARRDLFLSLVPATASRVLLCWWQLRASKTSALNLNVSRPLHV
ncbi:beta-lactamase [Mycena galopus ATCC 62051]|nr:beta-lactamase [Mycena galopus ATCC 62051]